MSVLEDLFYGRLNPSQMNVKTDSEYDQKMIHLFEKVGALKEEITESQAKLLEEIFMESVHLSGLSQKECFLRGFRLGAKMAWETEHPEEPNFK